jgi:signal transduction histidine kinase
MLCQPAPHAPEILPPLEEEQRNREFAVSATGVLHDLGNLIQIASSALNIVARMPDMPVSHRDPILHRARTSLDHAGTIVRQCVSRARDTAVLAPRSDIASCLADIAALVVAGEDPGLALDIMVEPGLPDAACDPIGLRRALLNLVLNARDAMGGKGIVRIEALADGASVDLRIGDHGSGMPPAVLARVFDPFFTTKRDGLGGIGLPMVERFVRGAGGGVSIESEPGIGTIVTLRLPALPQETQS